MSEQVVDLLQLSLDESLPPFGKQVVELLQEARQREAAADEAAAEVARYAATLQGLHDQRAMLYRQHLRLRAEWAVERAALTASKAAAEDAAAEAGLKAKGTQQLLDALRAQM